MGQVIITIAKDGSVNLVTKEIYGATCSTVVNTLSEGLGTVVSSKETPDAQITAKEAIRA